jgi:hypothetical protein
VFVLFRRLNDVPLEMELKNPATVCLRNSDEVPFDLDLFTLLRQMAQELNHVPAYGRNLRVFQLEIREFL